MEPSGEASKKRVATMKLARKNGRLVPDLSKHSKVDADDIARAVREDRDKQSTRGVVP